MTTIHLQQTSTNQSPPFQEKRKEEMNSLEESREDDSSEYTEEDSFVSSQTESYSSESSQSIQLSQNSERSTDSMEQMQEIVDAMQVQIRQYKQLLETTQSHMEKQISTLQMENKELKNRIKEKDEKLIKAADAIKTMVNDMKDLGEEKRKIAEESVKDKEDLAALYKRLGQLENSNGKINLNELEVSMIFKLEKNQIVSAEIIKMNVDQQKQDLKLQIEVLEKNLMTSKSELYSLKSINEDLNKQIKSTENIKKEVIELRKEKLTLQGKIDELNTIISNLKHLKKNRISIKGESNESNSFKEDAIDIISRITTFKPQGMFDQTTYEEFALLQEQNALNPFMFTHVQAQCTAKLKNTFNSFIKTSQIPSIQAIKDYSEIYNNVSNKCFFATYLKREAPHLKVYHDVLIEITQFNAKYCKVKPTTTLKKSINNLIFSSSSNTSAATNVMNNQWLRKRRATAVSVIPKYQDYSLLAKQLSQTTIKEDIKERVNIKEENRLYKLLCWTGKDIWACIKPTNNKSIIHVFNNINENPIQILEIEGNICAIIYYNGKVYIGKTNSVIECYNSNDYTKKNEYHLESEGAITHLESVGRKVIGLTEDKNYIEIDIKHDKKNEKKLSLQSDIRTAALVDNSLWIGTFAGLHICDPDKKRKTSIVKEIAKNEIMQVIRAYDSVWVVMKDNIYIIDILSQNVKKVISAPIEKIKLIGKQVWILQKTGDIKVYDSEKLELVTEHHITTKPLIDIIPVFKTLNKSSTSKKNEWVCIICDEDGKFSSIGTNYPYHNWTAIPSTELNTHTCYKCNKKFNKGGIYCKNCGRVFVCDKCRENVDFISSLTSTELCIHYPTKKPSTKSSLKKKL
ncbi:hypothetical protein, conserved [Entamoeba dispar SAW760]|uniref:Uncharacterized protein n=1 Tax=Entamoeba dispar (strain ATCC PRA-260 / SAW760) TaxID=370354 RepID=B0EPQ1_ENTDS|nr:uncharacterized protein EDI_096130 [Entamoeba dispar SAW760]EDR23481.1 hypothetical protein, conserved [Entamoeba dispar SAW760]|eukprot:EDR23481.1 hypothetical protein, conserved [Entamoeba dispar SAW760]